jgi:hypothetical protein
VALLLTAPSRGSGCQTAITGGSGHVLRWHQFSARAVPAPAGETHSIPTIARSAQPQAGEEAQVSTRSRGGAPDRAAARLVTCRR